jgi:hypothetical protein
LFGAQAISYSLGDKQPIVEAGVPEAFRWVENAPEVLAAVRARGLESGTVDYTLHEGELVILDVNKTPGAGRPPTEQSQRDYEAILRHVARGLGEYDRTGYGRRLRHLLSRVPGLLNRYGARSRDTA